MNNMIRLLSRENHFCRLLMLTVCLQCALFSTQLASNCTLRAQTGTWRAFMAYSEPQQIVKGDNRLYVRASDNLYSYSLADQTITTYDKMSLLSDTHVDRIAWNPTVQKLIIVYQNKNIDLLTSSDEVINISSYYARSMTQDKTVNSVFIFQQYAFLCTAFGVVKLNMRKNEVTESYILNRNIQVAGMAADSLYVRDSDGKVLSAKITANLIDPHSWHNTTIIPDGVFAQSTADWDQYLPTVQSLQPGGPRYNTFSYMRYENNRLVTASGGWKDGGEFMRPACAQFLESDNTSWTIIGRENVQPYSATTFTDATAVAFDPNDAGHYFLSTCGSGLYEFRGGQMVKNYTAGNSPIISALSPTDPNAHNYVRVDGIICDKSGNLWMTVNSSKATKPMLKFNYATNEWTEYDDQLLFFKNKPLRIVRGSILDRNGHIWMVNDHHEHPCMLRIDPTTDTFYRYDNFTNQDGTKTETHYVRCVAEDLDGNIWMGTDVGLYMYDAAQQADPTLGYTQIKVPRNDGTDLADYLLANVDITCIAVDGANRKWIGTSGAGVYLISADNMEQLQHFTTDNSPLLSNDVESIAVNGTTGEVFFGTQQGLCSYMSDATTAVEEMKKDDVYAFPNPVPHGYDGLITVRGLSMNADVRILNISGKLIAQGRSNGGTFTWNGRDLSGKRVASGVYMIATATSEGKKGVVAKVAIVR